MAASVPPATATSARPSRTIRKASPAPWAPAAQAVVMHSLGPVNPKAIATWPAEAFGIICGTRKGLTRSGPFSVMTWSWCTKLVNPPTPVEKTTAVRAGSTEGSPASSHASLAAATAKCTTRSVRLASLGVIHRVGSKSWISPAIWTGSPVGSKLRIRLTPLRPSVRLLQKASSPIPTGVTGPIPEMTTFRIAARSRTISRPPRRACRRPAGSPGPPSGPPPSPPPGW